MIPTSFILNGQSNAAAAPPVLWGVSALTRLLGPDILGWNDATNSFIQAIDGPANSRVVVPPNVPGPGLGQIGSVLARHAATASGAQIKTFALAFTSQNIDYFLPTSTTKAYYSDGTQHPTLNNYQLLKSYVQASGIIPQLYIWCQGEADAGTDTATYLAKLQTLYNQTLIDYPNIKWLIIGTIGNAEHRLIDNNGNGVQTLAGVFAAQQQLALNNPASVFFVDNRYMMGHTALFGGASNGNHYTTYLGYEECAENAWAVLQGTTRPQTGLVAHIDDLFPWVNRFGYRHSVANGLVGSWQGDLAPYFSLAPPNNAPSHIAYDPAFGNRTVVSFNIAQQQAMAKTGLNPASSWSIFAVALLGSFASPQMLSFVTTADNVSRAGLDIIGLNGSTVGFTYGGSGFVPVNAYAPEDIFLAHSYMFVVDATNQMLKVYVDGVLNGSLVVTGAVNMTDLWIGSILNSAHQFGGKIGVVSFAQGVVSDAAAAAAHAWAKAEFKLMS